MKLSSLVKEWLTEFKCEKNGYSEFYVKYFGNEKFYNQLIKCLENKVEVESICHQVYSLGLSKLQQLNVLLLDMLPHILRFYLSVSIQYDKGKKVLDDSSVILGSCLISVRNILYARYYSNDENIFEIPGFTNGSIYHSPVIRPDLDVLNENIGKIELASVNERSDLFLFPDLIKTYNYHLNNYSLVSLMTFCQLSSQIVSLNSVPRIHVSSVLLLELTIGIYSIIFQQDHASFAMNALNDIESRANHEFMTDVIVVICAIRNNLSRNSSGHPLDCQIQINASRRNRSNSMDNLITNANFRPEKVSEDIETVNKIQSNGTSNNNDCKAEIDLSDIGFNLSSNKSISETKSKFKIKFSVGDPVSNGGLNTTKIDNNRVIE